MEPVVLDTDVCSFLLKRDPWAELYRADLEGRRLCLSFQTIAELYQWAEFRGWGEARRRGLESWLKNFVALPFDNEVCRHWAEIRAARRQQPISCQDAWVAACARRHGYALVTHNAAHYANVPGLKVISHSA